MLAVPLLASPLLPASASAFPALRALSQVDLGQKLIRGFTGREEDVDARQVPKKARLPRASEVTRGMHSRK